jgi:1-deoxy-D-xylulose-5-phosphate reductoisomerase
MTQKILLLGATGSIGTRTLDVVRDFSDRFSICGLSTFGKVDLMKKQIDEFKPVAVNVTDPGRFHESENMLASSGVRVNCENEGLVELVDICEPDIVVIATVGIAGLNPALAAIKHGVDVALANKEVLVTGGKLVMESARKNNVRILPIDSEHNAIAQCLMGQECSRLHRIILTASGGPFRNFSIEELQNVTLEQALDHPTWNMGPKITIDSSTLMNKGFEVIEAHHLFDLSLDNVDVVLHPQSIIHSMVEFIDSSVLAQISETDMYLTIQNALTFPERLKNNFQPFDLCSLVPLTFEKPDTERFPCLKYAYEAARTGGTATVVLNAANEVAVSRFLKKEISYITIPRIIREVLEKHDVIQDPDLEQIFETDLWARKVSEKL